MAKPVQNPTTLVQALERDAQKFGGFGSGEREGREGKRRRPIAMSCASQGMLWFMTFVLL